MTLLSAANKFPPCLCRLLARKRHGRQPMTNTEIAHIAMISRGLVAKLSKKTRWDDVTLSVAVRFSMACGVNLNAPSEQIKFLRKNALAYQRVGTASQQKMYRRITMAIQQSRNP